MTTSVVSSTSIPATPVLIDRQQRIKLLAARINDHLKNHPSTTAPALKPKPLVSLVTDVATLHTDLVEGPEAVMMKDPIEPSSPITPIISIAGYDSDDDFGPITPTIITKIDPPITDAKTAKAKILEFVTEKSKKFKIDCDIQYDPYVHAMSVNAKTSTTFSLNINPLYLLMEEDIDSFLEENHAHSASLIKFLTDKKPSDLNQAASDLIDWYNSKVGSSLKVENDDDTKLLAKEILIMHSIGKLEDVKHFLLTHEMGHAHDHSGVKSLGDFNSGTLHFIKPNQYCEMNADLTAARELNAHALGAAYFEWRDIIAPQPADSAPHPTDKNRKLGIQIDKWYMTHYGKNI